MLTQLVGSIQTDFIITSSKRLKREINTIKDNNLFYQLQFK